MAKLKKELEKRSYEFEVRASEREDGQKIIKGRPIVYESETDIGGFYSEIIKRGALDEADLKDVRFLVNHNTEMIPLARSRRNNGKSTMQLDVDTDGMEIEVRLDVENNMDARALYSAVERNDISGMSFMFSVSEEDWENLDSDYPRRNILKIGSVVEVSAVTWPAYEQTEINARSKEALENARFAVETAKQQRSNSLDSENSNFIDLEKEKFKFKQIY